MTIEGLHGFQSSQTGSDGSLEHAWIVAMTRALALENRLIESRESLAQRDALVGELQEQVQVAQQESAGLVESLAQRDALVGELQGSLADANKRSENLFGQCASQRATSAQLRADLVNASRRLGESEARIRSLERTVGDFDARAKNQQERIENLATEVESRQQLLDRIFSSKLWRWGNWWRRVRLRLGFKASP